MGECECYSAESLDALGERIHELHLLAVVLVEQQVQLVKGGSAGLLVSLLVEIAQRHGVCQESVQSCDGLSPDPFA